MNGFIIENRFDAQPGSQSGVTRLDQDTLHFRRGPEHLRQLGGEERPEAGTEE
jgi:hypothetical protein